MKRTEILYTEMITHDVLRLELEKPENISYVPGQAADVALDKPEWREETRPFTFTSLPQDKNLEFTIKVYPSHNGVTEQIGKLKAGDYLNIGDVFGAIEYKGPGVFIAGGAGITPFIAIFKLLKKNGKLDGNKLIFANKTKSDIINFTFFESILGSNFINVLSDEKVDGFEYGYISKEIISKQIENLNTYIYLCGPPAMMSSVLDQVAELKIDKSRIVREDF